MATEIADESASHTVDVIGLYDENETTTKEPIAKENITIEPKPVTDEQIDDFLKEVEQIKLSSPIKPKKIIAQHDTPDTSLSSNNAGGNSSVESISTDEIDQLPALANRNNHDESTQKSIPKSVSQALFTTGGLKVTKIREKNVAPKFIGLKQPPSPQATKRIDGLQRQEYELTKKIKKLQSEIDYLNNLIETAGISSDLNELRKLKYAIERLQTFLDQKEKEKYEVGIQLTRAVRKRIDSGESGEFWVN